MKKILQVLAIFYLTMFCATPTMGQNINWVKTAGGTKNDHGRAIQVDAAGNIYVVGFFSNPSALFGTTTLSTSGTGTYLTKYSNTGNFAWARKISDTNVTNGHGLKTDAAGNSYVVTTFTGSVSLGSTTLTSSGSSDIVVAKYNTSGTVVWAAKAGGTSADRGESITIDAAGNSYITGSFAGTATFGSTSLTARGQDVFVAMLRTDGSFAWARNAGSMGADEGRSIATDGNGNVYVAGNYTGSASFGSTTLTSKGGQDIFLAAYNSSGNLQWATSAGGTNTDVVTSLDIDASGNLYLGGHFTGTSTFGSTQLRTNGNNQDIFLARYTNSGANIWAKSISSNGTEELNGLSVNADGDIYLTGSFSNSLAVGNFNFRTTGGSDIYAAHYLSDGTPQWLIGAGSGVDDRGFGIVSDASKNVYVTGYFQGATTSFGGIPIPNRGGEEIFISKLNPLLTTTGVTAGPYCAGQPVTVRYQTTSVLGRDYHAELSDANGSFANPVKIGSIHFNGNTGSITATIPANTPAGSKYRIRVVATNPGFVGSDNGADLTIKPTPPVPELTATSPSAGGTLYLSATEIPGATYSWTGPNGFTSNLREPSRSNMRASDAGTYRLTVNLNGCTSTASIVTALSNVPTYDVDLSGDPNGVYTSSPLKRGGSNCGGNNCIQFNIRLHKDAGQIEVTVDGGSGSMTYIINCDASNPKNANEPVCIVNTGILTITSCKPGGNANRYTIKSIAAFEPQADVSLTAGCSDILRAPATFNEADIVWEDLTGNGAYLKYLSFPNGKKNAVVTGDDNAPAYVDYRVRGTSTRSSCAPTLYYDDIRVYFFPKPVVTVGPTPAIICPGGSGVILSGNVTGGDGEFEYVWTNAAGVQVGNQLNYTATAVGTYTLKAIPKNSKNCEDFTATVDVVSNLAANAGPDQLVCSQSPVQLAGVITAATGGIWSGGGGSFSPSNTALNAVYTPTAAEIAAGSVRLTLTSTGNGSCTAVKDDVLITFYPIDVQLTGTPVICNGTLGTISAKVTGGNGPISYKWSSGQTTATITGVAAGTYTVTVSDGQGCAITKSFTVTQVNGPTDFTVSATQETCGRSDGSVTISNVVGGTAGYQYSADGKTYQTGTTLSSLAAGDYTIHVMDANGCTVSKSVTITNAAGPTAVTASTVAASCKNNDGGITVGPVTGGTAPYKYSINGSTFQDATSFTGLAAGTYTVTAQDANLCTVTTTVTITQETLTAFTATPASSTCGNSNGSITVSNVQGGVAPLYYSVDGVNFQTDATLLGLAAGNYTVTVRDERGCSFTKAVTVGNIAGPTDLTVSAKASSCGDSNAEITVTNVSGGTGTYTYSIDGKTYQTSSTFAGLAAGNYTVYVKDGNRCVYSEAVALTDMAGPVFTATAKASTCGASNGSITVNAPAAGYAPYEYALNGGNFQNSNTFSGLKAGVYEVTVKDANGCEATQTVEVTDIAGPSDFVLTATPSTCGASNSSITVSNVTGGTATYTYSIDGKTFQTSATFGNLLAREYTITVKDRNNCVLSKKITLTDMAGPTALTASTKSSTCGRADGEVTITGVTGGTGAYTYSKDGVNYQASATLTGFVAGTHRVYAMDENKCVVSASVTVTDVAGPTAVAATSQPASCQNNDGSITVGKVTGGTSGYTYSINGKNFQESTLFTGLSSGTYTITVQDANACTVTRTVTVAQQTLTAFTATPASSTCGNSNASITVSNVQGGVAPLYYSIDGVNFQTNATLSGLAAGNYTVTVRDARGCSLTKAVTVGNIAGPTDLTVSAKASSCGYSNAEVTVTNVTGGTGTYTYSIDGTNFQAPATFTGLAAGNHTIYVKDANGCIYSEAVALTDMAGPAFTATAKASTCGASNGSITISAPAAGFAPYAYALNGGSFQSGNTFAGLKAGEYEVTVKDANGCESTRTVEVTDIAGPSDFVLTATPSTCGASNGSITVSNVTGGTSAYTYSIDGKNFQASATFSNLLAREYTITVKDRNNCVISKKITLTNVAGPTGITASAKASTCGSNNGALTVSGVTGGTAPYTYSKDGVNFQASTTLTGFVAGTHTIYVKDANGCTFSSAFVVTDIAGPTAVAATSQPAGCANNDGSITVGRVTGGTTGYTYSIDGVNFHASTTFTGLASGTYTVRAKDANGCIVTRSVTVGKTTPTNFAATSAASTCGSNNGTVTVGAVTGGVAPYTYSKDGVNFQASATLTGFVAGAHTITVKDAKGCTFSKAVTVTDVAGPSNLTATATASTCGNPNGQLAVSSVTDGTSPYTYSIDGTNFQTSGTFTALAEGTYTLYVKDANGCTYSEKVAVNNIAGPSFTLSAKSSTCGANNGSITVNSPTGGKAPYTYALNNGSFQASATFAGLAAAEYNVTVKDANGCELTQKVVVTDIAGPSEVALTSTASTCSDSNGIIRVAGVTGGTAPYSYSIDAKNFQESQVFGAVLAGKYTLSVRDANGCIFTKEVVVDNVAGPTALTASTKASTCGRADGEVTVTGVTGGTGAYKYSKDGVNYQTSATLTGFAAGTHTVYAMDENKCVVSASVTVSNINGPTAVAATSLPASCQNNDGSITVGRVTGGTADYTYSINGTDFQSSTSFTGLAAGTYTLTAKDKNGCTVTASVVVRTNVPTAFASTTIAATCGRPDGQITVGAVTGGTSPYKYSINGSAFQTSATFTGLVAGSYEITVQDAKGCTFTSEVGIANLEGPTFTATAKATTCGDSNGSITVSNVSGGAGGYGYSINGGPFQESAAFGRLSAGTYTIAVRDMKGCVGTRTVVVDDVAGPSDMTLAAKASTCGAANATITVSNVVGGTSGYTYSIDGKNFQTSATFANLAAGEYTITVKDKNGCTLARTIDVTDIPGPSELLLTSTASTCGESNGKIEVSGVTGGTASYTFSIDGKTFQQGTTFAGVAAGEYTVTVKDANGCTLSKKIVVGNIGGPTGILASATSSTCGAANGKLTVTAATGGVAPYTYSLDGVNFQAGLVFENLLAGEHTLTVKDANGCTFVRTFSVTDIAGPTAVAATSQPASCQNNDGSISVGNVTGGTAGYTYSIDGKNFQASTSFTGLASGDYTVTVKDKNGCTVTTSIKVNQNVPTDFASTTVASTCGASNASITVGAVMGGTAPYRYSINGGSFQASATFANLAAGTYNLTVRDAKGCTFRKEIKVEDIAGPSALALTGKASTCGSPNASITVSGVTGGTAPYTFSLNNAAFQSSTSFGSLAAGKYEVTVKDANGCTFTQAITLENIPGPSAFTATASASSCGRANGSIKVDAVTGGTAPYTYSADGSNFQEAATLTGLLAGEHTITVKDANGCIITMKVVVEDVPGPSGLELASTASTCGESNGSITVGRVTGGTAPYKYSLDGVNFQNGLTFEGVLAGAYTITVEDAKGCRFSASLKVDNIGGPNDFVATAKASTCGASNGEVSISSVSGGTGAYTYSIDGTTFQASATFAGLAAGTHTITVKDANGCTFAKAVEVINLAGPSAIAATTKAASCADNDGSLTVTRVTGGTSAYTYSIDGKTFQSAATFSGLASGEYTITVRDANGCEFSDKVKVSKDGPASFASTTVSASCGGANGRITIASVDGGTGPYTYSINGGNFQASASFTALAAGAYTITVKDANQCTYSGQVMVGNVDGPSDLVATATNTTCGNSNGKINITGVTGGTKPYAYSIDGATFQEGATFTGVAAGEYLVTVKDAKGCLFVKPITVSNITGPEGFAFTTKASTCGSSNGEVTVTNVTGGTAPYTYSADGKTFQADAKLSGLAAGSHTITIKDANGCTFTRTAEVGNISGPEKYELATVATTCGAANGSITVSKVTGGTAPYTYALNNGSFQTTTTFANVAAGEYTIRVKDANGCILEKKVVVSDIAGPSEIVASTTPTACTANNGTITVSGVTGGKAPYTHSLDGKTFQATGNFGSLAAGEYEVYAKDANGCSTTVKVTVGIKGPKEAELASTNATCGEANGTITVTAVKEGTKPLAYSIDGKNFKASATFGNLAVGVYTITIKDAEGCMLEVTKEVSNSGAPTFTATGTDASCGAANGRIVISNVGGGVSPYTYSIDGTTFQNAPEFTGLSEGEYPVTVKDAAGCVSIELLTIRNTPPITNLKATVTSPTCEQPAGSISIDEVVGGTAPYTYSLDGATFTAAAILTDVAPGAYTLTVKDAAGCTYSIDVQVDGGVSSKLDYVHHLACSGGNTSEIAFATTGADAQTQFSIDGGKTFQKSPVFKDLAKGTYQLVTKFSEACTINVGTVEVKEAEEMMVEVTPLTKAVGFEKTGSAAVTKITGGVGPYTYSLDGGSFTSDSVFTNLSAREYTLTVKDSRGCMTTATFVIEGLGDIDIPNGFTPNGDGMNDTWVLKNLPNLYPNCQVTVYNRWGSEVFSSKGYKRPWDGTYKGKRLPDGTYYTIIEFGDGTAPIKTSVTIMR